MSDFTLASMYWTNPNHSPEDFREDMRRIKENKITLLRIMIVWEYVETERDKYDFSMYDKVFRAAEEAGVSVMGSFLFYLPFHILVEQEKKGNSDFDKRYACLDRPEIRESISKFMAATVQHYRKSPALKMWNLWNEPTDTLCQCPHSLEKFAGWLKKKYVDFNGLKKAWASEYIVHPPSLPHDMQSLNAEWLKYIITFPLKGRDTSMRLDWIEFQTENAAEHLAFLNDLVKRNDPDHETHSNPNATTCNPLMMGISPWKLAKVQDSISGSVHPHDMLAWLERDQDNYPRAMLSVFDLVRSWADGRDAWIGEYQAGSTYSKPNAYTPRGGDISASLYHSYARGLRGLVFWEWQSWRHGAFETAEFSLRNPSDGGPTERSEAAKEFGLFLEKHHEYLSKLKPEHPQVAVLQSMDQFALDFLMESVTPGKNINQHYLSAFTCHQALTRAGIPCDFVTESQLLENASGRYKVVFLPYVRIIAPETAQKLKEFVAAGGTLWADSRCGFLDKHLCLRKSVPGNGLDEVFGCREIDEVAPRPADRLILKDGSTLLPYREIQRFHVEEGAEVLADCNGYPAAVRNHYGKGTAELWGTYLTPNRNPVLAEMLPKFAEEHGVNVPVRVKSGKDILVSCCRGENVLLTVFTSLAETGQDVAAELPITEGKLLNDAPVSLSGGWAEFTIRSGETLPLLIQTK